MAGEQIKSTAITNLDAAPPVRATAGGPGGWYAPICADARCAFATAMDNTSTYKFVRLPSEARVKKVEIWLDAAVTTIALDVGVTYSDNPLDMVGIGNGKTGTPMTDNDLFAAAYDAHAIVTPTEITFQSAEFTGADSDKPIWSVADSTLTNDPGGFFDITAWETSTSSGTSVINMRVTYSLPYAD
jgi:hypothetical protein